MKEDIQMADKHMKRCLTFYVIRELQIKTAMECCYVSQNCKNSKHSTKCWQEYRLIATLIHCGYDCEMVQPCWKTVLWFLPQLLSKLWSLLAQCLFSLSILHFPMCLIYGISEKIELVVSEPSNLKSE